MLVAQRTFFRGQQIAYLPNHVLETIYGDEDVTNALMHRDTEFGFVTSQHPSQDAHYCRFWLKDSDSLVLRTSSCSELVSTENLVICDKVDQAIVDAWLARDDAEELHARIWHD
jgi:hypothetical protein